MNRFKKELRKRGIKLECDYPYLPFEEKSIMIEGITVGNETCLLYQHANVGTLVTYFDRKMEQHFLNFY